MYGLYPLGTGPQLRGVSTVMPPQPGINFDVSVLQENALPEGFQPVPVRTFDREILIPDCSRDPVISKLREQQRDT